MHGVVGINEQLLTGCIADAAIVVVPQFHAIKLIGRSHDVGYRRPLTVGKYAYIIYAVGRNGDFAGSRLYAVGNGGAKSHLRGECLWQVFIGEIYADFYSCLVLFGQVVDVVNRYAIVEACIYFVALMQLECRCDKQSWQVGSHIVVEEIACRACCQAGCAVNSFS